MLGEQQIDERETHEVSQRLELNSWLNSSLKPCAMMITLDEVEEDWWNCSVALSHSYKREECPMRFVIKMSNKSAG
jgi:hypothetical protein